MAQHDLQANERAICAFLDGMVRWDKALVLSGLHPDVVLRLPRPGMAGKTIEGAQNLADFVVDLSAAAYLEPRASLDCLVVSENHGAAEWRLQAKLVRGGDYDQYYCWMFDLKGGKITEIREYIDTDYGLEKNREVGGAAIGAHAKA